jgi:uncharacterized protein (DUF934 family)
MHKVEERQDPADGAESQGSVPRGGLGFPMIIDGQVVADSWQWVAGDPVPLNGAVIVPLGLWLVQQELLQQRTDPVGVWIAPGEELDALLPSLPLLPLIAVDFPVFTDGRGFSTARLLRERYGYRGELRAIGDVFKDTMFYLKRCGFNAFAVRPDKDVHEALKGLADFQDSYQGAVDVPLPLFRRR